MPSPAPDPLTSRPLSVWLVDPFGDIPGEGFPPQRTWSLARVLVGRGHDVIWWTATWSHRRKVVRTTPLGILEDEGFRVRLVATRPYQRDASLACLASQKDFARTFERLANEEVASGRLCRPDVILAGLPPVEAAEAAGRVARRVDATFIVDAAASWPATVERFVPGPRVLRRFVKSLVCGDLEARRRALVANADALAAATNAAASTTFADAPADKPRHVCPVGAYVAEFAPPPSASAAVANEGTPKPLECVQAADLRPEEAGDLLAATARQLSARGVAAVIHLVGTAVPEVVLRRTAAAASGACSVRVHGQLGRREYVTLLSRCEVGLVSGRPDDREAIPGVACDYAAAGLAIINTQPGELQDLIDRQDAGVSCRAGDAAGIAGAIADLAGRRGALLAMRQAARRLAERELDRERTYPAFADWIETIRGGG